MGSVGTEKGSRAIARQLSAGPRTSIPSQKLRVPSKAAFSSVRKLSSSWAREPPPPCSSTVIPSSARRGPMALAVPLNWL